MSIELSPRDNVLQLLKALPMGDQKVVMETFIFGATSKKGRAPKAEGAPKRAVTGDSYIHLVNAVVWPVLKAYGESLPDGDVKKAINTVSCRTQVSSALWAPLKKLETEERTEAIADIDSATIMTAFEAWKANPPEPHSKADKEARSVGSAGSKSSGASKKIADMTEDEKKAYYKARAAKAAATRAANKAKAEEPAEELVEELVSLSTPLAAVGAAAAHRTAIGYTFLLLGDQNAGKSTFLHAFANAEHAGWLELLSILPILSASFANAQFRTDAPDPKGGGGEQHYEDDEGDAALLLRGCFVLVRIFERPVRAGRQHGDIGERGAEGDINFHAAVDGPAVAFEEGAEGALAEFEPRDEHGRR
jgi:hypothetical protein